MQCCYLWAVLGDLHRGRLWAVDGDHLRQGQLLSLHASDRSVDCLRGALLLVTQTVEGLLGGSPVCAVHRHTQSVFTPPRSSTDSFHPQATPPSCQASILNKWWWGVAVAGGIALLERRAGTDVRKIVPHVPYVGNRGAHPMVHGVFQMDGRLAWALLASQEVWQHLLAEIPQHARLLGVHDWLRLCLISRHHWQLE